jgi:hypothetical protein
VLPASNSFHVLPQKDAHYMYAKTMDKTKRLSEDVYTCPMNLHQRYELPVDSQDHIAIFSQPSPRSQCAIVSFVSTKQRSL